MRLTRLGLFLLVALPAFSAEELCGCYQKYTSLKKDANAECRKLIGVQTEAQLRALCIQGAAPAADAQVKATVDQYLKELAFDSQLAAANKGSLEAKEEVKRLRDEARLWALLAASLGVVAIAGVVFLGLRSPRQTAAAPAGDSSMKQELKTLSDRLRAAESNALQAFKAATAANQQLQRSADPRNAPVQAQPAARAAVSQIPATSGGKIVTPATPANDSGSSASQLVAAYNAASRSRRQAEYMRFESAVQNAASFTVANARERAQNRDLAPVFRTVDTGPYFAVLEAQEQLYAVFPSLGKHPWGLRRDAAMSDVFDFPNSSGEPELFVKRPARFQRIGDDWILDSKGELVESL